MAIFEVKVPQLSESVAEATLLQWKKKAGDYVAQDEILIEIETDKVVLEVPAPSAGVLSEIVVANGGTVVSDELIAKIDSEGKGAAAPAVVSAPTPVVKAAPAPAPTSNSAAGIAMPAAAKILAEKNMSATDVAGSGKDGRVTKADALTASPAPAKAPPAPKLSQLPVDVDYGNRPEERVAMSRLRARIAERLLESQATNAILTTFNEVNMAPVINLSLIHISEPTRPY